MVSFGLPNVLATFMCLMNGVLKDYLDKFIIVILDDILIYSKKEEEHEQHLNMVLQVLRENQLYSKLSKCTLYQMKIHYLGHIISKEGIAVDPEKIEVIKSWSTPNNVLEVRSFMGLVGYYTRSIEGFSKVAHPITLLQEKGTNFEWTTKCEESFHHLKELLTSAPILKVEDPNEDFVACTDACKEGLGGFLAQNGHVICYESRKLKEHERNHATDELELADIVHSLKMWRHYLMVRKFKLKIDHSGLKHLFGQPTLIHVLFITIIIQYLVFLSRYAKFICCFNSLSLACI
jgi:hypothetical protein